MDKDFVICSKTHTVTRSEDGAVVFRGIDWTSVFFSKPPSRFSWHSNLCRVHNWMDGHFFGLWWHKDRWILASLGDHTLSRVSDGGCDGNYNFVENVVPNLCATVNLKSHPLREKIMETLSEAKFTTSVLPSLEKEKCYTFVLSNSHMRALPLSLTDVNTDPNNLGYGVYHICTRKVCDWGEDTGSIMGVRQPLVRFLVDHKEVSENINTPCLSFVGLCAMETFGGINETSKTAKKVIYLSPFWINVLALLDGIKRQDRIIINEACLDALVTNEVNFMKPRKDLWQTLAPYVEPVKDALVAYTKDTTSHLDGEEKEEEEKRILGLPLDQLLSAIEPYLASDKSKSNKSKEVLE